MKMRDQEMKMREYELKLKHSEEIKNMEKQSKEELSKILMNLTMTHQNH